MVSIAASMSASSNTITGALPPSSRCTRLSDSAAAPAIHLPVSGEPVRETMSMSGCVTSEEPAGRQRRADLPGGHHQRVVPRRDLAHDAGRLTPDDRGAARCVLARRLALRD